MTGQRDALDAAERLLSAVLAGHYRGSARPLVEQAMREIRWAMAIAA